MLDKLCGCRGRILVVDQDDWCREFLASVTKLCGYDEVILVTSVEEALEVLAERAFDLLITDLQVPDYHRLLEDCRQRDPAMRFILMAQPRSQVQLFFYQEHTEVVTKPPNMDEMVRKIRDAIHKRHRRRMEEELRRLKQGIVRILD